MYQRTLSDLTTHRESLGSQDDRKYEVAASQHWNASTRRNIFLKKEFMLYDYETYENPFPPIEYFHQIGP